MTLPPQKTRALLIPSSNIENAVIPGLGGSS